MYVECASHIYSEAYDNIVNCILQSNSDLVAGNFMCEIYIGIFSL